MPLIHRMKALLRRRAIRFALIPVVNGLIRAQHNGTLRIFYDDGVWIHQTRHGYFAYPHPYLRLNMRHLDHVARMNFFWGYHPRAGDVIVDIGAGVGEETLAFSCAVGDRGKVICVEAHPYTFQCLQKLVQYNRLQNVLPIHAAVTQSEAGTVNIEDSDAYFKNRVGSGSIPVPTTTIDAIQRKLGLGRIHFLKMNIEGSERLAIRGMTQSLHQIDVLCISCHDFLAELSGDGALRTKNIVREFFQGNGFDTVERSYPGLPSYLSDQIWAYNNELLKMSYARSDSAVMLSAIEK